MNDYTYGDMLKMQSEAKKRVLEMQKRSKYAVENFNSANRTVNTAEKHSENVNTSEEELPRVPKSISLPAGLPSQSVRQGVNRQRSREHKDIRELIKSVFGNFSEEDGEKMLILALSLLITTEKGDDSLLFALMYLLT